MSYIIVVKETDHTHLKTAVEIQMNGGRGKSLEIREGHTTRKYRYLNPVPLNQSNPDLFSQLFRIS